MEKVLINWRPINIMFIKLYFNRQANQMSQDTMEKTALEQINLNGIAAWAGIAGPLLLVATDLAAGLTTSWYNWVQDSISMLAWTPLGWIQTLGFLAIGLMIEVFVAGLYFNIRRTRGFGFGIGLLMLFGFSLLLIGAFHTDPVGGSGTIDGTIHGIAAKTLFWFFPIACALIVPSLKKDPYWKPLFVYTITAAAVALAAMIAIVLISEQLKCFGLLERIMVADEIIWVEVMAIRLFRIPAKSA